MMNCAWPMSLRSVIADTRMPKLRMTSGRAMAERSMTLLRDWRRLFMSGAKLSCSRSCW